MSLFIASLNSGSNGNCYYVGNHSEAVFIDAGLSCRETERRMQRLHLPMERVKAIFISHEHSDHIRGVPVLAKKYGLPVYGTRRTLQAGWLQEAAYLGVSMSPEEPLAVGDLSIKAFSKHHDACDPHSFTISQDGITIGVFTDIGHVCDNLTHHFKQCHAAFLEANYDDEMLMNGRYPHHLKQRIRGGKGHLSNAQAAQLFVANRPSFMSLLLLAHLSRDNNCPVKAQTLFQSCAGGTEVVVASRYHESAVYEVSAPLAPVAPTMPLHLPSPVARAAAIATVAKKRPKPHENQLTLF